VYGDYQALLLLGLNGSLSSIHPCIHALVQSINWRVVS